MRQTMEWEKLLDQYSTTVEERLKNFFEKIIKDAEAYHSFIRKAYTSLQEFVLRKGKRLAACTMLITYQGYGKSLDERILNASAGIELYRHSILVHDDLIDRDETRRGGKTIHKTFSEQTDERFGDGIAVFLGNIACTLALKALLESGFEEEKIAKVIKIVSEGYREVNESQMLDLLFEQKQVDVKEWYIMASKRAASLFKTTIIIGAILADAPENDIKILREAATHMGYAFDIQDDIIDTYASQEQYGRPPCGDFIQGKKPLHIIYTLYSEDKTKSEALKRLLGKKLNEKEVETARTIIRETGALEKAKTHTKSHTEKAKTLINNTKLSNEAKQYYNQLLAYIEESLEWYK